MSLAWVAAAVNAGAAERETVAFFETEELVVDPKIKRPDMTMPASLPSWL
jgi:hypothetical protein